MTSSAATTTCTATCAATASTATTRTARRRTSRLGTGLAVAGAAAALSFSGAGAASASVVQSFTLAPGQTACVAQYVSYQVRVDGRATGQGAKFKVLRNGQVIVNTANREPSWTYELRSAYGTFPGPGSYSFCASNTGTTNTIVTLQLRSDYEF
jgi:hypothetical protein